MAHPSQTQAQWSIAAAATSVVSAAVASICCIGPLVLALLGIGGAGVVTKLEPLRLPITFLTLGLLGTGFYLSYRKPRLTAAACETGVCEVPRVQRVGRLTLWIATPLVVAFLLFPYLTPYLFGE